ncbi:MAG: N-acetyl-gamma-glutamyl-phosphate reductase [Desulfosarcina sp.]|nr:N-acetyl-gamma-glutamyl-phosphate reductase [Desulfobacterales bacterium]
MINAGVVGATGYAGAELVRILSGHPEVDLTTLTSRQYTGIEFAKIYPSMSGIVNLVCEKYNADSLCEKTDVIFTALPHKLPMEIVPELIKRQKKVIDLSADFRFHDPLNYEAHYQPHTARGLLKTAVYGLCEVYNEDIESADLIGNPGCYPTSVLLPLIPLLKAGYIDADTITADSKSGVSGAGRSPVLTTHFCEINESLNAYKVGSHRHNPEMDEVLSFAAGKPVHITFVPHLIPMTRGMYTTIYASLSGNIGTTEIKECLSSYYHARPFIRLCPDETEPKTSHVRGTNFCDIGFTVDKVNNRLILMSAIDNLVKGAAGQAAQNMNIMFGLDERTGLFNVPFPL